MKLLTKAIKAKLIKNWQANTEAQKQDKSIDHKPVVKLFNPAGAGTWLLTELNPENEDIAFGLCDLGMGYPELGYVSISELKELRLPFGLGIERDLWFEADKPISAYANKARELGHIEQC